MHAQASPFGQCLLCQAGRLSMLTEQFAKGGRRAGEHGRASLSRASRVLVQPACSHACLKSASQAGVVWVSQLPSTIDAAAMEPIGSHFAVLLHDAHLRRTLTHEDSPPAPTSQSAFHGRFDQFVKVLRNVVSGLAGRRWSIAPPTPGEITAQR